jgi:ADP-ribose pyrophosphatase YjhB (NUDIX family)
MISCSFEDGKKALLRHTVVDILVIKDDKILLVKRAPHLLCGGKYGLIGGYVDRDENVSQAAQREILEETGYTSKIKEFFKIKDNPDRAQEDRQNIAFVFIAEAIEQVGEPDNESTEVKWFNLDNLPHPDEFAFDHYEDIQQYKAHLSEPFHLPIFKF